jgi:hypothetical protein
VPFTRCIAGTVTFTMKKSRTIMKVPASNTGSASQSLERARAIQPPRVRPPAPDATWATTPVSFIEGLLLRLDSTPAT